MAEFINKHINEETLNLYMILAVDQKWRLRVAAVPALTSGGRNRSD